MAKIKLFLIAILMVACSRIPQSYTGTGGQLYRVQVDGRWGFIDQTGRMVIKPVFLSAGDFSEGKAPVRIQGTYGYINTKGEFVIQPRFEAANSFRHGLAKVYLDSRPYFIDSTGRILFLHPYAGIEDFGKHTFTIAKTTTGKYGLINRKGELIADTIYSGMSAFSGGVAIVRGPDPEGKNKYSDEGIKGVIDTTGKLLVPFGTYADIDGFVNGYSLVSTDRVPGKNYQRNTAVIDSTGTILFHVPYGKWRLRFDRTSFSEGLAPVDIFTDDPDKPGNLNLYDEIKYKGAINTQGKIVLSNPDWKELSPFRYNRAFIKTASNQWFLINHKGQALNKEPYEETLFNELYDSEKDVFQNGIAVVKLSGSWMAIDTNGNVVSKPVKLPEKYRNMGHRGSMVYFGTEVGEGEYGLGNYRCGFWNIASGLVVPPKFDQIDYGNGGNSGLITAINDNQLCYVNSKGDYVWQGEKAKPKIQELNIDYMNRGYFYASSPYRQELAGAGGWGDSDNPFRKTPAAKLSGKGKIVIEVASHEPAIFHDSYKGIKLYLANAGPDTAYFSAQDSRLYLKLQARNQSGEWKDIEYLPSSWCGNSYHTLFLPPEHHWEFTIPVYSGDYKTKLRAVLMLEKSKAKTNPEEVEVYSNEFEGSVNPGQFWRKPHYASAGLMDPYNE